MRPSLCFSVIFSCAAATLAAQNQTPQTPQSTTTARSFCIKVQPGKDSEYRKLAMDVSKPTAQVRADAGEFLNRFLLRSVYPAGMDAVCDYSLVYVYPGFPPDPRQIGSVRQPALASARPRVVLRGFTVNQKGVSSKSVCRAKYSRNAPETLWLSDRRRKCAEMANPVGRRLSLLGDLACGLFG